MESLTFSSNGQWSLVKSKTDPEADNYKSYRNITSEGTLPVDHGTKGALHVGSNSRSPKQTSDNKMAGKVPTPARSWDDVRKPGSPGPTGDRKKV